MCKFLFWMVHCGIWKRHIVGYVGLVYCWAASCAFFPKDSSWGELPEISILLFMLMVLVYQFDYTLYWYNGLITDTDTHNLLDNFYTGCLPREMTRKSSIDSFNKAWTTMSAIQGKNIQPVSQFDDWNPLHADPSFIWPGLRLSQMSQYWFW